MKTNHYITLMLMLFGVLTAQGQTNTLTIPDVTVAAGKTISLPVNLDNTADIVAVQFTLSVPQGIELQPSSAALTERAEDHTVTLRKVENNKYMAMIFSPTSAAVIGRSGTLMTVKLTASSSLEEGAEFPMTMSDVVIAAVNGDNLATGFNCGKVTIAKSPDLEVSNVTSSATAINPGQSLSINWQVSNIGGLPTSAGWSEQIILQGKDGASKKLSDTYYESTLNAGGVVSRNVEIILPEIVGLDGEANIMVKLTAASNAGEPSWLRENNTALSNASINVGKVLKLSPVQLSLEETVNSPVRLFLTRSGSTLEDETFNLDPINDSRISIPESVTISKGQSGVYFYLTLKANGELDDNSSFNINISGNGYEEVSTSLEIEDDTDPELTIIVEKDEVVEGESVRFAVEAQRAPKEDLAISLSCDYAGRFSIPTIVLPAGKTRVEVVIPTNDDNVPDITQFVTFTASAEGYTAATTVIDLIDNDIPTLELTLTPDAVSESAGPLSVVAKLRRTDNIDKLVTIKFSDNSEGNIHYGTKSLEMPSGIDEVTVNLGPIDNDIVDGERTYQITAAVWIASCSCNAGSGTSAGSVTVPLTVYDNDGPSLSVKSNLSVVKEGEELEVTVSRNTSTQSALNVNVSTDHDSSLEYPSTVTIPVGATSATFTVKSIANDVNGDNFTATLTVESIGFAKANIWFTVSDQTLPDAQITAFEVAETEIEAESKVLITTTISNTGSYALPELTKVGIYHRGDTSPLETLYLQQPLAPGESVEMSKSISLPDAVGTYDVYAVANDGRAVKELIYTNNASSTVAVNVVSPFVFHIETDKEIYKQGEAIEIKGYIKGNDVADKAVEVFVINDGYRHVINVTTDEQGSFSTTYQPYSGQIGHFAVGGCYPKEGLTNELAVFEIPGIKRTDNSTINIQTVLGEELSGSFEISNPGLLPLLIENIKTLHPENCHVEIICPKEVPAGGKIVVMFTITPIEISDSYGWEDITLTFETSDGSSFETKIGYYCFSATGKLKADISNIKTTMIKGKSRDYPFVITNVGKGETGKISLLLPDWMKSVTPKEMPSMVYGESTTVILRFTPTQDMQLNVPVTGQIAINCENGDGLALPFSIEPVSETEGTLVVDVCDQYTYRTPEAPHVKDAQVKLMHPVTGLILAEGLTGENGQFSSTLNEGLYTLSVTAENHDSYYGNVLVDPGTTTTKIINLGYTGGLSFDFSVREVEDGFEDSYEIAVKAKFETRVPVPVVLVEGPTKVDVLNMYPGESVVLNYVATNKGLITALDFQMGLPEPCEDFSMVPLYEDKPMDIAPNQSVLLPVLFTRNPYYNNTQKARPRESLGDDLIDNFNKCSAGLDWWYYDKCGTELKENRGALMIMFKACAFGALAGAIMDQIGRLSGSSGSVDPFVTLSRYTPVNHSEFVGVDPANTICDPVWAAQANSILSALISLIPSAGVAAVMDIGITAAAEITLDGHISAETGTNLILHFGGNALKVNSIAKAYKNNAALDKTLERGLQNLLDKHNPGGNDIWDFDNAMNLIGISDESLGDMAMNATNAYLNQANNLGTPLQQQLDLIDACQQIGGLLTTLGFNSNQRSNIRSNNDRPSYAEEFLNVVARYHQELEAVIEYETEFFGDVKWVENMDEEILVLGIIMNYTSPKEITDANLAQYKPEWVTQEMFSKFIERLYNIANGIQSANLPDYSILNKAIEKIDELEQYAKDRGFDSLETMYYSKFVDFLRSYEAETESVCASISLQFGQKLVLTRQAFRGTLAVYNGHDTDAMEDIVLNLTVKDPEGKLVTDKQMTIKIEDDKIENFGSAKGEGMWSLAPKTTGVVTILYVPTKYAAPTEPLNYTFGGSLTYVNPYTGNKETERFSPVTLTVQPSPDMELTYFLQRDVIGDDPLTEAIEPSEEAEFALLINNKGYGEAKNVKIYSKAPEIVQNDKGLAIEFTPTSSALNGKDKAFGVNDVDFGTIPAHSTSFAQWWFESTLLGHFTEYDIKLTHLTSFGNPHLSLIDTVSVHELIRSVEVADINNKMVGFLTNDLVDANDTPDMLYLTNGEIQPVAMAKSSSIEKVSKFEYVLTVNPTAAGWNYGNLNDPTYGLVNLNKVVRQSDGMEISLRNFWQTDRTLRDGKDPLYENRIHFADDFENGATETYLLAFDPMPDLVLEVASIEGAPAEGTIATSPVEKINVMFNKYIKPETFSTDDLTLLIQGLKCDLSMLKLTTEDNKTFTIDFTELNKHVDNGYYVLTVQTSEITDAEGFKGKTGKSVGWNMYRDALIQITANVVPEDAGTVKGGVSVQYGKTVTLMAEPVEGYEFSHWSIDEEVVGRESIWSELALGDMTITANFTKKSYQVEIDEDIEGGSIKGCGTGLYSGGAELTLKAEADKDYEFLYWIVNDLPLFKEPSLTIVVDKETSVTAKFNYVGKYSLNKEMAQGWNWISSFTNESQSIAKLSTYVERILGQFDEVIRDPEFGFVGGLERLEPGKGYKIESRVGFSLNLSGYLHDLSTTPIELKRGWNWIAYPYFSGFAISDAIFNPDEGDYLTSQYGFTSFNEGKWEGSIQELTPGEGYLYKSAKDKTLLFGFNTAYMDNDPRYDKIYRVVSKETEVDVHKYPNTMNVTARLYDTYGETIDGQYTIYAMCGNELRGIGKVVNDNYYITIYGDEAKEITFVVENNATLQTYIANETLIFNSDIIGSRKAPYAITINDVTGIDSLRYGDQHLTIYTIEGLLISKDATIDDIRKLSFGIYIINGKKYLVR